MKVQEKNKKVVFPSSIKRKIRHFLRYTRKVVVLMILTYCFLAVVVTAAVVVA